MTTLTMLIEAVKAAEALMPIIGAEEKYEVAKEALCDYLLAHADDIAEHERLERAAVEAWVAFDNGHTDGTYDAMLRTKEELVVWLYTHWETLTDAHADDGAAT